MLCFPLVPVPLIFFFFFFNDTATTEIYTLSLHDALPISILQGIRETGLAKGQALSFAFERGAGEVRLDGKSAALPAALEDRKSTRLNSSHGYISYAVFCLKKKKNIHTQVECI